MVRMTTLYQLTTSVMKNSSTVRCPHICKILFNMQNYYPSTNNRKSTQETWDGNSSEHSGQTNSSSLTWIERCCLKLAKREKLLPHSGHIRLFSSCIATCRRRFSGTVYVCEHWVQRYGLSSSWLFKWALYLLRLSNSILHNSHVWTPWNKHWQCASVSRI